MKKFHYTWFALLLFAMAAVSCGDGDNDVKENKGSGITKPSWSATETIAAAGASKTYTFTAAGDWVAQSDKPEWCHVTTTSGGKDNGKLSITVDANETANTRSANISIKVNGYENTSQFAISQAGKSSGGGSGADRQLNQRVDDYLAERYLWNDEYQQMDRDLSLDYVSSSNNFMTSTLMAMKTNNLDKKQQSDGSYHVYSYLVRSAAGRSAAQVTRGVNHGVKKETQSSFGIAGMIAVRFSNTDGQYGLVISSVYPDSPAAEAGFKRGTLFAQYNGAPITQANLNSAYSTLLSPGGSRTVTVTENAPGAQPVSLTAREIYPNPVIYSDVITAGSNKVGYLVYDSFDAAYDDELLAAIKKLKDANITDMVLDLRNNGGGHVISSRMLSTCIAGAACDGKVYQYYRYNDARMANPTQTGRETGHAYDQSVKKFFEGFTYGNYYSVDLRNYALNLNRLYVLVTGSTASASEAVINALRGIDIPVRLIGEKTNGKNVGMEVVTFTVGSYKYELAPISFQGYNAKQVSVNKDGMTVDTEREEWDNGLVNYGERSEPLLAAALSQITGQASTSVSGTRADTGIRPATEIRLPDVTNRPSGMIEFLPETDETEE